MSFIWGMYEMGTGWVGPLPIPIPISIPIYVILFPYPFFPPIFTIHTNTYWAEFCGFQVGTDFFAGPTPRGQRYQIFISQLALALLFSLANSKIPASAHFNLLQSTSTHLNLLQPILTYFTHLSNLIYQRKEQALKNFHQLEDHIKLASKHIKKLERGKRQNLGKKHSTHQGQRIGLTIKKTSLCWVPM